MTAQWLCHLGAYQELKRCAFKQREKHIGLKEIVILVKDDPDLVQHWEAVKMELMSSFVEWPAIRQSWCYYVIKSMFPINEFPNGGDRVSFEFHKQRRDRVGEATQPLMQRHRRAAKPRELPSVPMGAEAVAARVSALVTDLMHVCGIRDPLQTRRCLESGGRRRVDAAPCRRAPQNWCDS